MNKQITFKILFVITGMLLFSIKASCKKNISDSSYIPTGFEAMAKIERLPVLYPYGTKKNREISYDASGGNGFGLFQAMFKKYVDQKGEIVFFDAYGPGCLYRQQMNIWSSRGIGVNNKNIRIRYYFDDEPEPRIDVPVYEFFNGEHPPVTPPFAFRQKEAFGIVYYPFSFEKRLRVTLADTMLVRMVKDNIETTCNWYQFDYITFPAGTKVSSWNPVDAYEQTVRQQWANVGEDPKDEKGNKSVEKNLSIHPGESAVVFDCKEQASIAGIQLKLNPFTPETFYNTYIRMEWDNMPAAVDLPLSYFFGGGGIKDNKWNDALKTLLYGFNGENHTMYCYFPMPFWKKATVTLINRSKETIESLDCKVSWKPASVIDYQENKTGYFHTKLTADSSPGGLTGRGFSKPYANAFKEQGHGQVIAINMWSGNFWEDGDEFTYIDGSRTPQIHGDGTEDDFNQGWAGSRYEKIIWGSMENGVKGSYRIHLNEPYIYYDSIDMRFEHTLCVGKAGNRMRLGTDSATIETEFVVWYYQSASGPALHLTDSIDIGNTASEKEHAFQIFGQRDFNTLTQGYDSYESVDDYDMVTDDGRSFDRYCEFKANLSPDNQGVRIRNRINRKNNGIQTANVYVDGKLIPQPWYILTYSEQATRAGRSFDGWFDSEYEIPAAYTKGKKQINIKIEYVQAVNNELNIYNCRIYCYK